MTLLFKTHNDFYVIDEYGQPGPRTHFKPGDEVPQWVLDSEQDVSHLTYDPDDNPGDENMVTPEDSEEYAGFNKEQLQELLAERELPISGNKAELIERLEQDDAAKR